MSDIMSIGESGLAAAQWGLNVTSENISNASTPGYSVENPVYQEDSGQFTGSGYIGGGVSTTTVQRAYSAYLNSQLNSATSTNSSITSNLSLVSQLNNLVGSPTGGISAAISAFFTGMSNVASSPSSVATRQTAISDAQTLASEINAAGQEYDQLGQSVNQQLQTTVSQINQYSAQIASLNSQIMNASSQGQPPNQLLDQRDQAVAQLSQLVGVSVGTLPNGSYSVTLNNGQPLVTGNSSCQLGTATSQSNPAELSVTFNGLVGQNPAPAPEYMGDTAIASAGGTLGGLMAFRTQTLDPAASQLGSIVTSFTNQVNSQNSLGITLTGAQGGNLFSVAPPAVYSNTANTGNATLSVGFANGSQPTSDDYSLSYNGTTYTLTDTTTNTVVGTSATAPGPTTTIGGLTLNITSGAMAAGDSFTIQPTAGALDSFSLATTSASAIAAASPVVTSTGGSNNGTGTISTASVTSGYSMPSSFSLTYNSTGSSLSGFPVGSTVTVNGVTPGTTISAGPPATTIPFTAGATYTVTTTPPATGPNNVTFTLGGAPANGDTFNIGPNTGTGDGSNATAIADLASQPALLGGTSTLGSAYSAYVNNVGNAATALQASSTSQTALVQQITQSQQSVSGVNLDEEASNLLQYQQLYQANSKVIQTAETIFSTLMGIFQ